MTDLSSVERRFAYDRIRLENKSRGTGVDYQNNNHLSTSSTSVQDYSNCKNIPFIPLPFGNGSGSISSMELHEMQLRECRKKVDLEPENVRLWIQYIAVYEDAAEEATSKKERVRKWKVIMIIIIIINMIINR